MEAAVDLATAAGDLQPNCYEALYARARTKRELKQYPSAIRDVTEALKMAPNNAELTRLLARMQNEQSDSITQ